MGLQPVTLVIPDQETGRRHPVAIAQHKRIKLHAARQSQDRAKRGHAYAHRMTDQPADAGQKKSRPPDGERADEPRFRVLHIVDLERSDNTDFEGHTAGADNAFDVGMVAAVAAVAIYSKAFLETLARHNAEWLIDAVHTRIRKNGETEEALVGAEDNAAATLVITRDTPDEARLELLDLDVTAPELRGKELRWDEEAGEWRPSRRPPGQLGGIEP